MCSAIPLISVYISLITDDVYSFLYTYLPYLYKIHIMWWGIYWNSLSVYLLVCLFSCYQFKRAFYTLWTHLFEAYLVNFILPINIFFIGVFFGVYVFNLDEENLSFFSVMDHAYNIRISTFECTYEYILLKGECLRALNLKSNRSI